MGLVAERVQAENMGGVSGRGNLFLTKKNLFDSNNDCNNNSGDDGDSVTYNIDNKIASIADNELGDNKDKH